MSRVVLSRLVLTIILALTLLPAAVQAATPAGASPSTAAADPQQKIAPFLQQELAQGKTVSFLVILKGQADLSGAAALADKTAKGRYVYDALRAVARQTQPALLQQLQAAGAPHRPFWIVNMIEVEGDAVLADALAARPDVARIDANPDVVTVLPSSSVVTPLVEPTAQPAASLTWPPVEPPEPGIRYINADDVWFTHNITGTGIVVAGADTGVDWGHPGLLPHYRGNDDDGVDHNYNWMDMISGQAAPYDDHGHGTHTMGTMVGLEADGTNPVGVAPGARWIACKNMPASGAGNPASYAGCYQFFIAPYPIGGDPFADGDPSQAPHVVNNSWSCPPAEGCNPNTLLAIVQATQAAGIVNAVSAGNSGSACSTVNTPVGTYDESFTVGAFDGNSGNSSSPGAIASFSSRGPSTFTGRIKPNVSAPGVNVNSTTVGGGYSGPTWSGTSMAAPHVAGAVALLLAANADLIGAVDAVEDLLESTALPRTSTQSCGGTPGSAIPNNTWGWGTIDVLAAVEESLLGGISGVISAADLGPLANARVHIWSGAELIADLTTAADGVYLSPALDAGAYQVAAYRFGYASQQAEIFLASGQEAAQDFSLEPQEAQSLLLVDDDLGAQRQVGVQMALENLGESYDWWETSLWGGLAADTLDNYCAALWLTGDDHETALTPAERTLIETHLTTPGQGALLLSGEDIGYQVFGRGSVAEKLWHIENLYSSYAGESDNFAVTGAGLLAGHSFTLNDDGGSGDHGRPDRLVVKTGGQEAASYGDGYAAAISHDAESQLLYLGFNLADIADPSARQSVLADALYWLGCGAGACPADVDRSGQVDIVDIFAVLAAWSGDYVLRYDLNRDGTIDLADVMATAAGWNAGCQ